MWGGRRQEEKGTTEDKMVGWSLTRWTWVWTSSRSWWWTGKPGVLRSMGLQSQTRLSDWMGVSSVSLWFWFAFSEWLIIANNLCLLVTWISSSEKCLFKSFALFCIGLSFYYWILRILCILDPYHLYIIFNYFPHSMSCLLTFLIVSFEAQNL